MTTIIALARVRPLHVAVPHRRSPVELVARRITIAPSRSRPRWRRGVPRFW